MNATEAGDQTVLDQIAALGQSGRFAEAQAMAQALVARRPDDADALHLLGLALSQGGKPEAALEPLRRAIALQPDKPLFLMHYGVTAAAAGQLPEAEASLRQVLTLRPGLIDAQYNLALVLERQDRLAEAAQILLALTAAAPGHAMAWLRLGTIRRKQDQFAEALAMIDHGLNLAPRVADGHFARGMALQSLDRKDDAEAAYRQALVLQPNLQMAINNLGNLLSGRGQLKAAMALYEDALAQDPNQTAPRTNLARILAETRQTEAAIAHLRFVLAREPDNIAVVDSLVFHLRELADWSDVEALTERLVAGIRRRLDAGEDIPTAPFTSLSLPLTSRDQQAIARTYARKLMAGVTPLPPRPISRSGPLRIGYLSADFREHPIAHLTAGLFAAHDRNQVTVTGYALGPADDSHWRQRIMAGCDSFVILPKGDARAAAERIRSDGIDILVDLTGYTMFGEQEILAWRPAPVQVNWLGFPGTFGASFADYILADAIVIPPDQDTWFDETVIRLPGCYQVYDRDQPQSDWRPTRVEVGLPENGFVFSCFNNAYKFVPEVFADWMEILRAVPDSVLWLLHGPDASVVNLREEAQRHGVAPNRLVFARNEPKARHLARYALADLMLDTPLYNAHTTASDSLWAGVPVLTRLGATFAGRVAASLLSVAGLHDLIAVSRADYVARAVALAGNETAFADVKHRLSKALSASSLFDVQAFARKLEDAYRQMRER